VILWLALRRLLPLLAVLSLALTPVTAPAATVGLHAAMMAAPHDHRGHAMPGMATDDQAVDVGAVDVGAMDVASMDDMPCCPHEKAAKPDCAKGCPLMALCLATVASLLPAAVALPVPVATRASVAWPAPASFASLHGPPLPEPPRA
jgi:uncharacterized protein involved in copper resistance